MLSTFTICLFVRSNHSLIIQHAYLPWMGTVWARQAVRTKGLEIQKMMFRFMLMTFFVSADKVHLVKLIV